MNSEIIAIIDNSGSMGTIINDTIEGFNAFLKEQQAVPGEAKMTTVLFNSYPTTLERAVPLEAATPLSHDNYHVGGGTALLDAIGKTLNDAYARIKTEMWGKPKVIVAIITDGEENSSREFTIDNIKDLIKKLMGEDWLFQFMGADLDSFQVAASLGISSKFTSNFSKDAGGVGATYSTISASSTSFRSGVSQDAMQSNEAVYDSFVKK